MHTIIKKYSTPFLIISLIFGCVISRLLPHPFNFSPIESVALFSGFYFTKRWQAALIPLIAMVISDWIIGLHTGLFVVYGCIITMVLAGTYLKQHFCIKNIAFLGFASALFFFLVTNFSVWLSSGMYPVNFSGLIACYIAAIPFFHNQLAGVAFYSTILFGAYAMLAYTQAQRVSPTHTATSR